MQREYVDKPPCSTCYRAAAAFWLSHPTWRGGQHQQLHSRQLHQPFLSATRWYSADICGPTMCGPCQCGSQHNRRWGVRGEGGGFHEK